MLLEKEHSNFKIKRAFQLNLAPYICIMIQNDTIIALATPSGVGAISVIRLSGENAIHFVEANFKSIRKNKSLLNQKTHTIHLGHIIENNIIFYNMT